MSNDEFQRAKSKESPYFQAIVMSSAHTNTDTYCQLLNYVAAKYGWAEGIL